MPVFGEYETNDEPLAVTPARNQTTTVWLARKSGASDGRQFAIKSVAVHRDERTHVSDETLGADPGLEFIETVKQLKKAQADGSRDFAPLHAFGTSDLGCWYATDYCARGSLKTWINLRGGVDSAAVRHVVSSLAEGCKSLKKICGRSHGNLKPSNVLLQGKARPLKSTPLLMVDPMPVSTSRISGMDTQNRAMVENIFEAQDLRAIGEIIVQLVEGRLIERESDYAYPIESSADWQKLGKGERRWRELCNRLLDPQLELEKTNLDWLAREFPAGAGAQKLLVPLAAALVVGAAGLVFYLYAAGRFERHVSAADTAQNDDDFIGAAQEIRKALKMRPADPGALKLSAKIFTGLVQAAQNEINDGNWKTAQQEIDLATTLKPGDPAVTHLNQEIQRGTGYQAAFDAGQQAFENKNYDEAIRQAKIALEDTPGDNQAQLLETQSETAKRAIEIQESSARDQGYQMAIAAARADFAAGKYDEAVRQADIALDYRPGDSDASNLKTQAQNASEAAVAKANETRQAYETAMQAGRNALEKNNFDEAIRQANLALNNRAADADATHLLNEAKSQQRIAAETQELQNKYKGAMSAGKEALSDGNYAEAIHQAKIALDNVPGDSEAIKLQNDAAEAQSHHEKYAAAMTNGRTALSDKRYEEAIEQANIALENEPADNEAAQLKMDAQNQEKAAAEELLHQRNYQAAMAAGREALRMGNYDIAIARAKVALDNKRDDPDAIGLENEAEDRAKAAAEAAARRQNYNTAMVAAQAAYDKAHYKEAMNDADTALENEPGDPHAQQLKNDAQAKQQAIDAALAREQRYQNAMVQGRAALSEGRFQEAVRQVNIALETKPGDPSAKELQSDVQERLFTYYIATGNADLTKGDYKGAIEYAKAALTIKDDPGAQDILNKAETEKKTLDGLDAQLSILMKSFGVSQERGSSVVPTPNPKVTKITEIDDITQYLTWTTNLEQAYVKGGWLDLEKRQDIIQRVRKSLNNY